MKASCKLCSVELESNIVGDEQAKATALGEMMMAHIGNRHLEFAQALVPLNRIFNGFLMMNRFIIDDNNTVEEMERMRTSLCEEIMKDAPEDVITMEQNEENDTVIIKCPNCDEEIEIDLDELEDEENEEDEDENDDEEEEEDEEVIEPEVIDAEIIN